MNNFIGRHPAWSLVIVIAVAILLFLIFAVWPPELEQAIGRKRLFLSALLNGITLGGLYFLVASGFTLIFGLMRNVNLAHGSLYLFGGYLGYEVAVASGSWILTLLVVFIVVALLGIVLQFTIFRWMEGQDLRQTLVTIALSLILADLMLWRWGGDFYQVPTPSWLAGPDRGAAGHRDAVERRVCLFELSAGAPRHPARRHRHRRADVARAQPYQDRHSDPRGRR